MSLGNDSFSVSGLDGTEGCCRKEGEKDLLSLHRMKYNENSWLNFKTLGLTSGLLFLYLVHPLWHAVVHDHHHQTTTCLDHSSKDHFHQEHGQSDPCLFCIFFQSEEYLEKTPEKTPIPQLYLSTKTWSYSSYLTRQTVYSLRVRGPPA